MELKLVRTTAKIDGMMLQACQFSLDFNIADRQEFRRWVEGDGTYSSMIRGEQIMGLFTENATTFVMDGDWVIVLPGNRHLVVPQDLFERLFTTFG